MGLATATALVGTGLSAFQTIKSGKEKRDAKNAMNNYNRVDLENPYENIQLSTYGTDIMKEQSARNTASAIDAVRGGGARLIASTLPKIQANANKVDQNIAMDLEQQDLKRQYAIARGDENILRMKEQRDRENIAAISSQYNAANQNFNQGLWGVASGAASTMRGLQYDKDNGDTWFKD